MDVPLLCGCQLCISDGGGLGVVTSSTFAFATEHAALFFLHARGV